MNRELGREFAKHPISVPIEADPTTLSAGGGTTVNNFVTVTGNNTQLAWDTDGDVTQNQDDAQQTVPGYEEIARSLTEFIANLAALGLGNDEPEAKQQTETVLTEVAKPNPDKGVIKRGSTMIKGILAPITAGVSAGVTPETSEAARHMIEVLSINLPF